MKNLKLFTLIGSIAMFVSSCSITLPYTATNNTIGSKRGVSKTTILGTGGTGNLGTGIVFNKNYGVIEAVKNGDITTVATVDIKVTNYYIFQKLEVIVTGE